MREQIHSQVLDAVRLTVDEQNMTEGDLAVELKINAIQAKFVYDQIQDGTLNFNTTMYVADILMDGCPVRLEFS